MLASPMKRQLADVTNLSNTPKSPLRSSPKWVTEPPTGKRVSSRGSCADANTSITVIRTLGVLPLKGRRLVTESTSLVPSGKQQKLITGRSDYR